MAEIKGEFMPQAAKKPKSLEEWYVKSAYQDFVRNCPYAFKDRYSYEMENFLSEETQWEPRLVETNFIADVRKIKLDPFPERGNRTSIVRMSMAGCSIGMHIMGVSEGTYVTAH